MKLGEKILKLRKKQELSQEQLGEKIHVTRQTISNWELGETAPNPEQLKLLSKVLHVSIDELLDNDTKEIVIEKISNTERLAGLVIKILKFLGIAFLIFFIIDVIACILFLSTGKKHIKNSTTIICTLNHKKYQIEISDKNIFTCDNCSKQLKEDLKKMCDFDNIDVSISNIEDYFNTHNGTCE